MIKDLELNEIISSGPDIEPIAAVEVDPSAALSPILYEESYATAMSYLRALMLAQEYSARSLALTDYIIARNPSHYTVWTFRYDALLAQKAPLSDELKYVQSLAMMSSKNYQVWHHRELVVRQMMNESGNISMPSFIELEKQFLAQMLAEDAKNYHVWSYRQFLCRHVRGFVDGEEAIMSSLIQHDPWNNSAWNHRYFVLYDLPKSGTTAVSLNTLTMSKELEYTKSVIDRDPDNAAVWNYFKAIIRENDQTLVDFTDFIKYFNDNLPALECLLSIYVATSKSQEARDLCSELKKRDPIRSRYWDYRSSLIV